ncbi:MAG: phosphoribosylformylglycinamidine synthase [Candidatus Symbiothrix sp.]|jgi:phosphoribosylformylglycinamidine synthase|nr:phosphoribosylformylglycinamidine synthase [Candidatus Symbiothrix sp.]
MILFFQTHTPSVLAVQTTGQLQSDDIRKLMWLFGDAELLSEQQIAGTWVGPRREMITPWSTNAVEITQIMGIKGILRIEEFQAADADTSDYDPMLQRVYDSVDQDIFTINKQPENILPIRDIAAYNQQEGLALSDDEIQYLNSVSEKLGRPLTDSEVFGFSQVNSEHCRHKIFNGIFVIDGVEKESTLFQLIKKTSQINPNKLVSAYKDNVAFNQGPTVEQFAPANGDRPDFFEVKDIETVISLKAETHNFPTTVEPFNGAATGTGGEIRDRLGGGKASLPIAGTAVYMTSYPLKTDATRGWHGKDFRWLYQTPQQILIKASNGASDFGNKFGQPLICGSVLTFEHEENDRQYGYDKVIMLAGGVGFAKKSDALKGEVTALEKVVLLGGDNYRIGMGGGAVSSVDTGQYASGIELNAVQRANPEMQKRVANVIRSLAESDANPIVSIHDHGAGGHLNCLSELVETTGGKIDMSRLPVGDPTLSAKEIIGNESQERMGLVLQAQDIERVQRIADRERAPMYVIGETTGDMQFVFEQADGQRPLDMQLSDFFGKPPRTVMNDVSLPESYQDPQYDISLLQQYIENVLQLEAVACKDWLTNKVDRSVTGRVARQQCVGEIQLPLSDLGAVALDYRGQKGIATSIGHAPQIALADAAKGSVMAIAEALTNIVFAPLTDGINSVSLSANWMWACKNQGEDARLYKAVEACSDFACALGINIPTGKDSLSMTQKYGTQKVYAPGTVIISAGAEVSDVKQIVSPVMVFDVDTKLYYIDFSRDSLRLGGSAFAQTLGKIGSDVPTVTDAEYFKRCFNAIQTLIKNEQILAGHDVSAGGLITTLLEMCFANELGRLRINLNSLAALKNTTDVIKMLFAENSAIVVQVKETEAVETFLKEQGVDFVCLGTPRKTSYYNYLEVLYEELVYKFNIDVLCKCWYKPSFLLDCQQSGVKCAKKRFRNFKHQVLQFHFPAAFKGDLASLQLSADRRNKSGIRAAIIREKGTNGEREMAYALYLAGFDVKDVHTTDLVSGRETLEDVNMIVFCGGFSNSDVLGSAKGWAGALLYNEKAQKAIENYYKRSDTLSLGICNGCQLMIALNLITPHHPKQPQMLHNDSHKFESGFVSVNISYNDSVMFGSLSGSQLGIWVAHGEGKFSLPMHETKYNIVAKYTYGAYPANPNGSDYATAGICSANGRHLAMMPHLERAIFPWQWAHYPADRKKDEVSPWIEAFVNARRWIENHKA